MEVKQGIGEKRIGIKGATAIRAVVSILLVAVSFVAGLKIVYSIADFQQDQYFEVRKYQAAAAAAAIDWQMVEDIKARIPGVLALQPPVPGGKASAMRTPEWKAAFKAARQTPRYQAALAGIMESPSYREVVGQLKRIKDSDKRFRFVYIYFPMYPDQVEKRYMVFLADAEKPGAKGYSSPGDPYLDALPVEFAVFTGRRPPDPIIEPKVTDVYGHWTSALACIQRTDQSGLPAGRPIALLGTDVNVEQAYSSFNEIRYTGLLFDILISLLLALVCLQWIMWRYNRDRREALREDMEASILRLNEELREADRLKSEFIESASHELRGPVAAVDGALQVMSRHLDDIDDTGRELMSVAMSGSERLANLVDNLLDVTRIEAGDLSIKPERVDLSALVVQTVKIFEALARDKGLAVEAVTPEEPVVACVDREAVQRVLENLLSNAIKYTDEGSVSVELETTDDVIRFIVRDTGKGIPEKFQDEVFQKFSRLHLSTDSRARGAGLGLSITKGLTEAHHGRISVDSEEGKGSAFTVEIPWPPEEPEPWQDSWLR